MRLTTRSRYALIAIADLAIRSHRGPVALSTISERHGMSLSYLEMLFSALRRAGLVSSTRGPGGGYSLGRSANDITVADIALASEQGKAGLASHSRDAMSAHQGAMTQALWQDFNQAVVDHLSSVSLAEVVKGQVATDPVVPNKPVLATARQQRPAHATRHIQPRRQLPGDDVPNSVFALGAPTQRWG